MAYWQMDDGFLGHHKTKRAIRKGPDALVMWVALRTYVAVNTTDGVIFDEDIDDLPHAPKNPRKWLKVLHECGEPLAGGARGPGLVDRIDGGWRLHNYDRHGLSPEEIERRRAAARERKRKWLENRNGTASERRSERVPERTPERVPDDVPNASVTDSTRAHEPIPSPTPGEDPPTPLPPAAPNQPARRDLMALSLQPLREDVTQLHAAYRKTFGLAHHRLTGSTDVNALHLSDAIDAHGLEACLLVLRYATEDGMVSGKTDERNQKHEKISYIFGNPDTFARILRAAEEREGKSARKRSAREVVEEARRL